MQLPSRRALAALYVACGVVAGTVSYAFGQSKNLEVFRHASRALLAGRDLYDGSSVDWFKYSPTFAALFVPFALVPAWLAAALWGALNFGVAYAGIDAVARERRIAALVALPGILLATDGDQANLLVAGLMLLAFAAFERDRSTLGAAAVALGTLVKIFPLAAALFALTGRDREKSLFRIIVALVAFAAVPLAFVSPTTLAGEYASWLALLRLDHANRGWSIITIVRDLGGHALPVQLGAAIAMALPFGLAIFVPVDARFRRQAAAAALILIVLCNHRSEYASFVVSAIGAGLWFAESPPTPSRILLFALAAIAHGPMFVRSDAVITGVFSFLGAHRLFHPLRLAPLGAIWLVLQFQLAQSLIEGIERMRSWRARASA